MHLYSHDRQAAEDDNTAIVYGGLELIQAVFVSSSRYSRSLYGAAAARNDIKDGDTNSARGYHPVQLLGLGDREHAKSKTMNRNRQLRVYRLRPLAIVIVAMVAVLIGVGIARADEYEVQPGDNLARIAQRFGTNVELIVTTNNLRNPNQIFVGQTLTIPDGASAGNSSDSTITASKSSTGNEKGLAMAVSRHSEDLGTLGVSWLYVWGWCSSPDCVPMVRAMQDPPTCPATLLVGNEPNAREPNGAPVTPADAATRVVAIETQCPNTTLVVGNVAADDWSPVGGWGSGYNWLSGFLSAYRTRTGRAFSQTLGVHCYSQHLASYCTNALAQMQSLYSGPMWVTEFGILSGDAGQFGTLLGYIASHFDKYAA